MIWALLTGCQSQMQQQTHDHGPFGPMRFQEGANVDYPCVLLCL